MTTVSPSALRIAVFPDPAGYQPRVAERVIFDLWRGVAAIFFLPFELWTMRRDVHVLRFSVACAWVMFAAAISFWRQIVVAGPGDSGDGLLGCLVIFVVAGTLHGRLQRDRRLRPAPQPFFKESVMRFFDRDFFPGPHGHFHEGRERGPEGFGGFGGPRFGGPGPHGPRGGRRVFEHGDIRFLLLALLEEKPAHGYELIKQVEERMNGAYAPSPGLVYPTLTMLEEMGYIASEEGESGRKRYAIADEGRGFLKENAATVERIVERMKMVGERHKRGEQPQIMRAMMNLKMALHLKTEPGALSPEQVKTIAAVIDEAAAKIEDC